MKTIILGERSNLTKSLKKEINSPIVFSSKNIEKRDYFKKIPKRFNLIINLFYPTSKLENIDNYVNFFHQSIIISSKFLESVDKKKINKIIYTSSASVYGSLGQNISYDNKKLYASSKILLENYIKNFSIRNKKKTIIARVFNMYDENESFSIISKITKKINKKEILVLNNRGESIRDFIHSRDVAKIYKFFLKENISGIFDVGSGYGIKIIDIFDATRPVEVAAYDTYPLNDDGGFYGCWGAYPFTSNGYVYASDMQYGLYVFDFEEVYAGWVYGSIYFNDTMPLENATMRAVLNNKTFYTDENGAFSIGFPEGEHSFIINEQDTVYIEFLPHQMMSQNIFLSSELVLGDVNQDNVIDVLDIIIIVNCIYDHN